MSVIFRVNNLSFEYGSKTRAQKIFNNLSFEIKKGESVGVIGRNGVGKSTLLRLVAGIIEPTSGDLIRNASSTSLLSLQAGFIPALSGRENIELSSTLLGLSRRAIKQNMQAIIDYADLEDHIDRAVATYSTGMKARLGFSVAKYCESDFVLIDEVLGVGDQEFKDKSAKEIEQMIASDRTVMLVSHSEFALKSMCDRLIWLEYGRVIDEGDPETVYENYKTYNIICMAIAKDTNLPPSKVRHDGRLNDPLKVISEFEQFKQGMDNK